MCNNREGFVKLAHMKVPDTSVTYADMSLSMKECEQKCLRNCSCMAYASANESEGGIGCLTWQGDLVDTRTYADLGQDLYIRVDAVVLGTLSSFIFKILEKHFTKIHSILWLGHRFGKLGKRCWYFSGWSHHSDAQCQHFGG